MTIASFDWWAAQLQLPSATMTLRGRRRAGSTFRCLAFRAPALCYNFRLSHGSCNSDASIQPPAFILPALLLALPTFTGFGAVLMSIATIGR
jgi:hypothetical protein